MANIIQNIKRTASAVKQMAKADQAVLKKLGNASIKPLESMSAPKGLLGLADDVAPAADDLLNLKSAPSFRDFQAQKNFNPWTFESSEGAVKAVAKEVPAGPVGPGPQVQTSWNPKANSFQAEMAKKEAHAKKVDEVMARKKAGKTGGKSAEYLNYDVFSGGSGTQPVNTGPTQRALELAPSAGGGNKAMVPYKERAAAGGGTPPNKPGGLWDRFVDGHGPQKVTGGLLTAWTVQALFGSRGEQSNAELYNQQ